MGMTTNAGKLRVSGTAAQKTGTLDIYTLEMTGGEFSIGAYGKATVNGTLNSDDENFSHPSMIVDSGTNAGAVINLEGTGASLTTEFGLYIARGNANPPTRNVLQLYSINGESVTLNGNVYTYGFVHVGSGRGGSISSNGDITINNGELDVTVSDTANSAMTWTCRTFTADGNNGVTVSALTVKKPANSTTYQLIKTTAGPNSVLGNFTKGQFNGGTFPATWGIPIANDGQEFDLKYTKFD
jgi:hypothetical protein